jgi:CO/xanthine dehydrogenase Mo-binding subunit
MKRQKKRQKAPAIANALAQATQARIGSLPIRNEKFRSV